jgi:hypothetical protein
MRDTKHADFASINDAVNNETCRLLVYTQTMTAGISITNFKAHVILALNIRTCNPITAMQMAGRVRDQITLQVNELCKFAEVDRPETSITDYDILKLSRALEHRDAALSSYKPIETLAAFITDMGYEVSYQEPAPCSDIKLPKFDPRRQLDLSKIGSITEVDMQLYHSIKSVLKTYDVENSQAWNDNFDKMSFIHTCKKLGLDAMNINLCDFPSNPAEYGVMFSKNVLKKMAGVDDIGSPQ